mmetsp:Transcript_64176/g.126048  ORF Transcript_64176/g.126048 Transcript_64176/m.126048 type:complete len:526 (+) Transcript_64176:102-1679(+)
MWLTGKAKTPINMWGFTLLLSFLAFAASSRTDNDSFLRKDGKSDKRKSSNKPRRIKRKPTRYMPDAPTSAPTTQPTPLTTGDTDDTSEGNYPEWVLEIKTIFDNAGIADLQDVSDVATQAAQNVGYCDLANDCGTGTEECFDFCNCNAEAIENLGPEDPPGEQAKYKLTGMYNALSGFATIMDANQDSERLWLDRFIGQTTLERVIGIIARLAISHYENGCFVNCDEPAGQASEGTCQQQLCTGENPTQADDPEDISCSPCNEFLGELTRCPSYVTASLVGPPGVSEEDCTENDLYSCGTEYNYAQDRNEAGDWQRLTGDLVCAPLTGGQVDATDDWPVLLDTWMKGNSNEFNQDCVWWGRGQLQVTNPLAYGFVSQLAEVAWPERYDDLCSSPNLLCETSSGLPTGFYDLYFFGILAQNMGNFGYFQDGSIPNESRENFIASLQNAASNITALVDTSGSVLEGSYWQGCTGDVEKGEDIPFVCGYYGLNGNGYWGDSICYGCLLGVFIELMSHVCEANVPLCTA